MGKTIYWAASLHSEVMRKENGEFAEILRSNGHRPLLPQWSGVWEDMYQEELARGATPGEAKQRVKKRCFDFDLRDMNEAEACILFAPAIPSEGACFELGYMYAQGKPCCLFVPSAIVYDEINLMITRAAPRFDDFDEVLDWINELDINIAAMKAGNYFAIFHKERYDTVGVPGSLRGLSRKSGEEAISNAMRWLQKNPEYTFVWV